jgi:hypothetical protein
MKFLPAAPRHKTNFSETKLFESLKGLGADLEWTVIHSAQIGRDPDVRFGETDFYVLIPGKGIVAIEAKAPSQVTYKEGNWNVEGTPNPKKSPLAQADRARGAMRKFIEEIGIADEVPIARMVWFTSLGRHQFDPESGGDFQFHEWELAWKQDLLNAPKAVERVLDEYLKYRSRSEIIHLEPEKFTSDIVGKIAEAFFANFDVKVDPSDLAKDRAEERSALLAEQAKILGALEDNPHIYIEGSAGSGKSFLIAEAALRAKTAGKRTLVTCWSLMMAEELQRMLRSSSDVNFVVKDINAVMLEYAGLKENPLDADSQWYEHSLPKAALKGLERQPFLGNFSSIMIDEFQDLVGKPDVLVFVLSLSKNMKLADTQIVLAGDERQQILVDGSRELGAFQTAKTVISDLVKYKAKANTRMNPKLHREMCELLGIKLDISEHRIKSDNAGGLNVLKTSPEKQAKVLRETLKELLISYGPHEIRILSPFGSNRSLIGGLFLKDIKQNDEVWLRANARHADSNGEIRWRSIPKFKGLESEVVVITDIGLDAAEFFNEKNQSITDWLYVGISRARHRCVVISTEPMEELLEQQTKSTARIAI